MYVPSTIQTIDFEKIYPNLNEFHEKISETKYSTLLTMRTKSMRSFLIKKINNSDLNNKNISILDSDCCGIRLLLRLIASKFIKDRQEHLKHFQSWGIKKYRKFINYSRMFPEYNLIFIGDSGQGDIYCARLIVENTKFKTYIHNLVINADTNERCYDKNQIKEMKTKNINLFDNYTEMI